MSQLGYYVATLAFYWFIYSILSWGLNLQFGETGIINFAYIAFSAVGAYVSGVLTLPTPTPGSGITYILGGSNVPFPLNIILGGIAAALVGGLMGLVVFRRLRSDYLAIVLISMAFVLYDVINNASGLFDGADGLSGISEPFGGVLHLNANSFIYVFTAITAVIWIIMWVVMNRVTWSPFGRTLRAIRDDEEAAEALGVAVFGFRMRSLLLGSFYAGVAGGLTIEFVSAYNPSSWTPPETFVIFAALIVGGLGNNLGCTVGALAVPVLFTELPQFLPQIPGNPGLIPDLDSALVGVLLIVVLWVRPQGLIPERKRSDELLRKGGRPGWHRTSRSAAFGGANR